MLSVKMCTALHAAVLVAIFCATAQTEPPVETPNRGEANDPGAKTIELNDPRPNPAKDNNQTPSPPKQLNTGNGGQEHEQDLDTESGHETVEESKIKLSRTVSALHRSLVESARKAHRKRTLDMQMTKYPYVICYAFTKSYSNKTAQINFRQAADFISSRTCLTFIDITLTVNASDPDSPTKLGCRSNSYIRVILASSCYAPTGMQPANSESANTMSPCSEMTVILHEMEHLAGALHVHMGKNALDSFSIFPANVQQGYWYAFDTRDSVTLGIDGASSQRYPSTFLSRNGELTLLCIRPDQCTAADYLSTEETLMAEINILYKCNEYACGNSSTDCTPGYFAKKNGVCQCNCPKFLDPNTNCKTLINGPFGPTTWPTKAIFLSGGNNVECPAGTTSDGTLGICGNSAAVNPGPTPFPSNGNIIYLQFCAVTSAKSTDMFEWPFGGDTCFIKPKDIPCSGKFNNVTLSYTNYCPVSYNGTAADITVNGNLTTIMICCKKDVAGFAVYLPNNQPITTFAYTSCPRIEGMRYTLDFLAFGVANRSVSGYPEKIFTYDLSYGFYWYMCFQRPPKYGCNLQVTLGIAQRSVNYVTPGYPAGRVPNMRCLIYVVLQPNFAGVVKVTFNNISLDPTDQVMTNRFGIFTAKAFLVTNPTPKDIVSEERHIYIEFYSGLQASSKSGLNLTLESILGAQFVYNDTTKGANYLGTKNVTENYKPCVAWKAAYSCYGNPVTATDEVLGFLTNNYCRNSGGSGKQPWCYTYVNGSTCFKEYCDVSEFQQPQDRLSSKQCAYYIASQPGFCDNLRNKLSCAMSCNFPTLTLDQCLPGNDAAGQRCISIPPGKYNRTAAQAVCAGKGPSSGPFQILQAFDADFIRQYRFSRYLNEDVWVDGAQTGSSSDVYYSGTTIPLLYTNFSAGTNPDCPTGCAAALLSEDGTPSRQGSMWLYPINDPNFQLRVVCQTLRIPVCGQYVPPADGFVNDTVKPFYYEGDRLAVRCKNNATLSPVYTMCKNRVWTAVQSACADSQGDDKYSSCQAALANNARFCQLSDALSICPRSCGATGVCTAPTSATYVRTSPNNTCTNGQFMTFACANGSFLTGGDTERACGLGGDLLGKEPVCETKPREVNIGLDLLVLGSSSHLVNTVCVLDREGYRVPIPGNVSAIYCMAISVGNVTVAVYNKNGSSFTFKGANQVFCEPGFTWWVPIPSNQQIPVQVGDVVGVHATVANTLTANQCGGFPEQNWIVPCAAASTLADLATANFNSMKCLRVAMAYVVTSANVAAKVVNVATTSTTRATTPTSTSTASTSKATKPTTTKRSLFLGG